MYTSGRYLLRTERAASTMRLASEGLTRTQCLAHGGQGPWNHLHTQTLYPHPLGQGYAMPLTRRTLPSSTSSRGFIFLTTGHENSTRPHPSGHTPLPSSCSGSAMGYGTCSVHCCVIPSAPMHCQAGVSSARAAHTCDSSPPVDVTQV